MSQSLNPDFMGYFSKAPPGRIALFSIGAVCYIFSMSLSCFHIYRHFQRGREETKITIFFPQVRRKIIWQLMWVPVTTLFAFLSLLFPRLLVLFNFVTVSYQAFSLFAFLNLISDFAGGKYGVASMNKKKRLYSFFPLSCCFIPCEKKSTLTPRKLTFARLGVLQSSIIQPIVIFVALFLTIFGLYEQGNFVSTNGYIYLLIVNVLSTITSMYFIVVVHRTLKSSLKHFDTRKKFLLVQILVPLFTVQTFVIALIYKNVTNGAKPDPIFPTMFAAVLYEKFLILLEGVPLTILAHFAYPIDGQVNAEIYQWVPGHRLGVPLKLPNFSRDVEAQTQTDDFDSGNESDDKEANHKIGNEESLEDRALKEKKKERKERKESKESKRKDSKRKESDRKSSRKSRDHINEEESSKDTEDSLKKNNEIQMV